MENLTQLSIKNLERTSKNWDKRTKDILLFISGGSNMFGGSTKMLHITLHGENSIVETGTITINGVVVGGYNISRGANGVNWQKLSYYKGVESFSDIDFKKPTYTINIEGSCTGAEDAMCAILSAEKDWKY